ncbi:MAG: hypothetical protein R3191_03680 [Anaerolineales bacterium]|nr:hypothetical protein [Anaerolineales bacterium]
MTRVFRPESGSSKRNRMLRQIATALRYAVDGSPTQEETWDLLAFVVLCLHEIESTVEQAAEAWERRDYWVKADRYRHTWSWVHTSARELENALAKSDVEAAMGAALDIAQAMDGAKPYKARNKRPWQGAFDTWRANGHSAKRDQFAPKSQVDDNED